jgi:hypothetical protein
MILITELWIETENDIMTENDTDNNITETHSNLIENIKE